jgi:hypothetical protein
MIQAKCAFAAPMTVGRAACRHAVEVVRRGGIEVDCASPESHMRCAEVFAGLKGQGLAEFGVTDDPTTMPHSVLVKIQTGGLSGLMRILDSATDTDTDTATDDIADLIARALSAYGDVHCIPYADLAEDMRECRIDRRGRRRGR